MDVTDSKRAYNAPQAKVVEAVFRTVLCQSTETGAATIEGYEEDNLDW